MILHVENAYIDNQYRLVCQYIGVSSDELRQIFLNNSVVAYELPRSQTLECVWDFRLYLATGEILVFTSKCTSVGGWNEVGSLSVELNSDATVLKSDTFIKTSMKSFYIATYSMLVYEEGDVYSEAGICFTNSDGERLIVAAGSGTGAVSVSIPNISTPFEPEFFISDYHSCNIE